MKLNPKAIVSLLFSGLNVREAREDELLRAFATVAQLLTKQTCQVVHVVDRQNETTRKLALTIDEDFIFADGKLQSMDQFIQTEAQLGGFELHPMDRATVEQIQTLDWITARIHSMLSKHKPA